MRIFGPIYAKYGAQAPFGYGLAYIDWALNVGVCYRWPLNHVVAAWRRFWFWARDARQGRTLADTYQSYQWGYSEGYQAGLIHGKDQGFVAGVEAERGRVARAVDELGLQPMNTQAVWNQEQMRWELKP